MSRDRTRITRIRRIAADAERSPSSCGCSDTESTQFPESGRGEKTISEHPSDPRDPRPIRQAVDGLHAFDSRSDRSSHVPWRLRTCPSASVNVFGQRGGSPCQADAHRPVSEGNCVLVTRGGKQLEEIDQSVTRVNSIRPGCLASLLGSGQAQTDVRRKPRRLRGSVSRRSEEQSGGWRRNDRKARHTKQGDLSGFQEGVHVVQLVRARAAEEPAGQESERSSERGSRVMPGERRDAGRWMRKIDDEARPLSTSIRSPGPD